MPRVVIQPGGSDLVHYAARVNRWQSVTLGDDTVLLPYRSMALRRRPVCERKSTVRPIVLPTFVENRLPVVERRARAFERCHGVRPDTQNPKTFSEKMNVRVLRDRRPELVPLCDKLAMKEVARSTRADVRVPRTFWAGTNVRELADVAVDGEWVLKPNHATKGRVILGSGPLDVAEIERRTRGWLADNRHSRGLGEWAYTHARRMLLLEERVGAGSAPPQDHKVFVFHGKAALLEVHDDRFGRPRLGVFRPDGTALPPQAGYLPLLSSEAPAGMGRVLDAAADLAPDYDFMRVDLYDVDGQVWFGEFTPYPASGMAVWSPREVDDELGQLWTLPSF